MLLSLAAATALAQQSDPTEVDNLQTPLPDPLTLVDAINLSRDDHPRIERVLADLSLAESRVSLAEGRFDWNAYLDLDARTVDKILEPGHYFRDDSRASIFVHKLLLDFGRSRAAIDSEQSRAESVRYILDYQRRAHDLDIMEKFFDVYLADQRFFVDDEDMTLAFLRYDQVRERRERFEERSRIDELELESVFRNRRVVRMASANRQRHARRLLALSMGRPNDVINNVHFSPLDEYNRPVPDYDELLDEVLEKNPLIVSGRLLLVAAEDTVRQYQLARRPELSVEFEANEWSFERGNRDAYVAGLRLLVPLGGDSAHDARIAEAMAEQAKIQADIHGLEYELREQLLELLQRLDELNFEAEAAAVNETYRDLYLDRSRTLYQLEVRADLGDSQARQAEATWRTARVLTERAITWARIDAMRGIAPVIFSREETR